jgi:hypothetical protein
MGDPTVVLYIILQLCHGRLYHLAWVTPRLCCILFCNCVMADFFVLLTSEVHTLFCFFIWPFCTNSISPLKCYKIGAGVVWGYGDLLELSSVKRILKKVFAAGFLKSTATRANRWNCILNNLQLSIFASPFILVSTLVSSRRQSCNCVHTIRQVVPGLNLV